MATFTLDSDNVLVSFPNVEREYNGRSRLMSEQGITQIFKSLSPAGVDGFIIENSNMSQSSTIEFILGGYYFQINKPSTSDIPNYKWVGIHLTEKQTGEWYQELVGIDDPDTDKYTGLIFGASPTELSSCDYKLQLFDDAGNVYSTNYLASLWKTNFHFSAYFFAEPVPDDPDYKPNSSVVDIDKKLWIDTTDNLYIPVVYNSELNKWIKLGAVYKSITSD